MGLVCMPQQKPAFQGTPFKPCILYASAAFLTKNIGVNMKTWQCIVCGFIYDEAKGLPEDGIAPGTVWADVPANWECPDCGVSKSDFEMVQI